MLTEERYTWQELAKEGSNIRELIGENRNDIAYWLSPVSKVSKIPIPKTKLIGLTDEYLGWLCSDHYTDERKKIFNDYLIENIKDDFDIENLDVFVKTGTYSHKFIFHNAHVKDKDSIGRQFVEVFYGCMMVGAGTTPTVAVREFINPKDKTPEIYYGMPLRRELRFFVDFDEKKIIGYSEYWDDSAMKELARDVVPSIVVGDISNKLISNVQYVIDNEIIVDSYKNNKLKDFVTWAKWKMGLEDVSIYLDSVVPLLQELADSQPLEGKWSVDVMFNGVDEPWLIDMALMNQSALVDVMKEL